MLITLSVSHYCRLHQTKFCYIGQHGYLVFCNYLGHIVSLFTPVFIVTLATMLVVGYHDYNVTLVAVVTLVSVVSLGNLAVTVALLATVSVVTVFTLVKVFAMITFYPLPTMVALVTVFIGLTLANENGRTRRH